MRLSAAVAVALVAAVAVLLPAGTGMASALDAGDKNGLRRAPSHGVEDKEGSDNESAAACGAGCAAGAEGVLSGAEGEEIELAPEEQLLLPAACSRNASGWISCAIPERVLHVLHENWTALDPDADKMISYLSSYPAFHQFSHARSVFRDHLIGTFSILAAWGQPRDVIRPGMFHTIYSGDLFQFFFHDAANAEDRAELRAVVGRESEHVTHLFGTINRLSVNKSIVDQGNRLDDSGFEVAHRLGPDLKLLSPQEVAKIFMVTIADYLDQMVEVNGWRDHHQVDRPPRLFPGDLRPTLAIHWFSAMCHAVRDYLDVIPTAFDNCQTVLSYADEKRARDAYWHVVRDEESLSWEEQVASLEESARVNPFVGEPHVLLSQLHFRAGNFERAAVDAARALDRFFSLASAWDKRLHYKAWVAYARVMLLRSNRRAAGLTSLPLWEAHRDDGVFETALTSNGLPLISLKELVAEL